MGICSILWFNTHFYKYVYYINLDNLLEDLVKKLTGQRN